jgi:hypothetical protein
MRNSLSLVLPLLFLAAGCAGDGDPQTEEPAPQTGDPSAELFAQVEVVPGNPGCSDLAPGLIELKVEPVASGSYSDAHGTTVTVALHPDDGLLFDWTSSRGIDAVIVKGGPNSNVYSYDPEAFADTGLHAPMNPSSGKFFGLSHISFCYDFEVEVDKTAATSFTRSYTWSIEKTGSAADLTLAPGQIFGVDYSVAVAVAGSEDSDFAVAGTISVHNPAPFATTVTSVTDELAGAAIPVECGVSFPFELGAGETLVCTYAASLADASTLTNTATAETTGLVGAGSGSAAVDFAGAAMSEIDGCVDVDDDLHGALGSVCAVASPATFGYTLHMGPFGDCGPHQVVNTASFAASSTGASGQSSWTLDIDVPCPVGCSLTPGYWKTHSEHGPAPYDDTWAQLAKGADTAFFLSGLSYLDALLASSADGNAYFILAHAYIAAELNQLSGADFAAAADAFAAATALFEVHGPAEIAALSGSSALRAQFIALAATLDDYNNGVTGPGHCSKDAVTEAADGEGSGGGGDGEGGDGKTIGDTGDDKTIGDDGDGKTIGDSGYDSELGGAC